MTDKTELLKKLHELALRGVGGEKETAEVMLQKLMEKYGVEETDLDESIRKVVVFKFHGKTERRLLKQIAYKITNEWNFSSYCYTASGRPCRTDLGVECTEAERVQISFLFDFYTELYKKEVEFFLSAFIQKHRLFGTLKEGESCSKMSREELFKMTALMEGMEDASPLIRLEGKHENQKA